MEECKLKIMVVTDTTPGSIFSHVAGKRGVEDDRCSVDKLVEASAVYIVDDGPRGRLYRPT